MGPILKEGKNCWRIRNASRVAFLVDGAAYFDAFARSAAFATESILIAGWDIDSRIRLFSQEERGGLPSRLREFMKEVVRRRKTLHVHILEWDFAVIYAFERELFPIFSRPWRETKKIHFHLDSKHPVGGSHHQKVVVIDDGIAFVGGVALTRQRWDTPEHARLGRSRALMSFPSCRRFLALDRIWVGPKEAIKNITVHSTKLPRRASDHLPVVAEVNTP